MYFEWHKYKVQGVSEQTGRKRTLKIIAHDEESAEKEVQERGLMPPYSFQEEEFDAPSDRQIDYALDLGIRILPTMNKKDVSALIDKKLEEDSEPEEDLIEFAYDRNIYFSFYIGEKSLCNLIFDTLVKEDKVAFFCYAVNQSLEGERIRNLDTSVNREQFYEFASLYSYDETFWRSLNSYRGEELIFFGKLKDGGEVIDYGGSTRKKAYKLAKEYIRNGFSLFDKNLMAEVSELQKAIDVEEKDFDDSTFIEHIEYKPPITDTGNYLEGFTLYGAAGVEIRLIENAVVIKRTGLSSFLLSEKQKKIVIPIRDIVDVHIFESNSWWKTSYIRFIREGDDRRYFSSNEIPNNGREYDSTVHFADKNNLIICERIKYYIKEFNVRVGRD